MRLIALLPLVLSLAAFILSFLCLFAGNKPGFLSNDDVISMNTSRIAIDIFNTTSSSSNSSSSGDNGGFWSSIINTIEDDIHNITDAIEQDIEDAINDGFDSFAKVLGLHDFYTVNVMSFCEGYYKINTTARNVTYCSNRSSLESFNPGATIQRELNSTGLGITLEDLHWPEEIDFAVNTLKSLINAMFVLYCIGIAATGLAMLGALIAFFLHDRLSAIVNLTLALIAFIALLIASSGVTAGMIQAVKTINIFGAVIDVSAARGNTFLGMTWAATSLMFFAAAAWVVEIVVAKKKRRTMPRKQMQ